MAESASNGWVGADAQGPAPDSTLRASSHSASDNRAVRVRFAPSPTGALHIGNVRSALFNYLFARHAGGTFVLRIDDTDHRRDVAGAAAGIMRDLRRLGLRWDEGPDIGGAHGPYVQSKRSHLHAEQLERLLNKKAAYRCWCTEEELAARKAEQMARGEPPRYDRRCLALSARERRALADSPYVVRLRLPDEVVVYDDLVFGPLRYDLRHADDPILNRSDGSILYDLSSVVDDHVMGITHILRGDTWLSTTPAHIVLFRALGWEPPAFGHLPQIVGSDRKKLAKRHGARSLEALLDAGYLPEALQNALALLGWSPGGDREVLEPDELIADFTLDRVQRSPALFDIDRLDWLNRVHVRRLALDDLVARCTPYLAAAELVSTESLNVAGRDLLGRALGLVQDRLHRLSEAPDLVALFYRDPIVDQTLLLERGPDAAAAAQLLTATADLLDEASFTVEELEAAVRAFAARQACPTGRLFWLMRVATTGCRAAPPLFAVLSVLGRASTTRRLRSAAAGLMDASHPSQPTC